MAVKIKPQLHGPRPNRQIDGDKKQARRRINVMVKSGRLPKPSRLPCKKCGDRKNRHTYHHYMGYAAKNHEMVIVLCYKCHANAPDGSGSKKFCKRGHKYTKKNTIIGTTGKRNCRECRKSFDKNRGRDASFWRNYRLKRKLSGRPITFKKS